VLSTCSDLKNPASEFLSGLLGSLKSARKGCPQNVPLDSLLTTVDEFFAEMDDINGLDEF
jgi:hypothetical protein